MALSKELEEELTCPIDLEFFIEPMSLKCLHVLCKKDVDHMMESDGLIMCPQCKTVSQERDIKPDFRTQRLLDLHTADKDRLKNELVCENCEDEVATCRCEQCKGYFGEKCAKGHRKFETTKHHNLIKLSAILDDNNSLIKDTLDKMKTTTDRLNEITQRLSEATANLDVTHHDGLEKLNAAEEDILKTMRSVFTNLRTNFEVDIANRKETLQEKHNIWQANMQDVENKVETLQDLLNKNDQKTILNKDLVENLTRQNTQHCERITNELQESRFPSQNFTVVLSPSSTILKDIERLKMEIKDNHDRETFEEKDNIALNHDVPVVKPKTRFQMCRESSPIQHPEIVQNSRSTTAIRFNDQIIPNNSNPTRSSKAQTLLDYTKGSINTQKLTLQSINSQDIRHLSFINDRIWLVMSDGTVNVMQIDKDAALSVDRTFLVQQLKDQILMKIIIGPEGKLLGHFWNHPYGSLCEINERGRIIAKINNRLYDDIAADDSQAYGKNGEKVDVFAYQGLSWKRVQTVSVSGLLESRMCAYGKLVSIPENCGVIRHDFKTNERRSVSFSRSFGADVLLNDNIGNVLLLLRWVNSLAVLRSDDTVHELCPDLEEMFSSEDVRLIGATLDSKGRLLALLNDKSLWLLRPE